MHAEYQMILLTDRDLLLKWRRNPAEHKTIYADQW
jgi:hypothetical protein